MFEHLPGDECGGGLDDGEPVVGLSFPAGGDAPPVAQPAVGAFDGPAVAAVWVAGFGAAAVTAQAGRAVAGRRRIVSASALADHRLKTTLADPLSELLAVVAAVGPQLAWPDLPREQLIKQRQQLPTFVLVAGADLDRERDAVGVDDQVETAARAGPE